MKRYLMNKSEDKKTQETGVNDFLLSDVKGIFVSEYYIVEKTCC